MEAENAAVADSWRFGADCTRFLTRKITNSVGLTMPSCCSVVTSPPRKLANAPLDTMPSSLHPEEYVVPTDESAVTVISLAYLIETGNCEFVIDNAPEFARMKPSEYWVVPTPTPLNVSGEWTTSGDFLNRLRAEAFPSHELSLLGSKTELPIISLSGTTTTGILVLTPVSKSPPRRLRRKYYRLCLR